MPVIHRVGVAVNARAILRGDASVMPDHFQRFVAEQGLQGQDIPAISQIMHGKRVSKTMRVMNIKKLIR